MKDRNRDLHKLKKREFFLKMKKYFFENRLLRNVEAYHFIENLRIKNLKEESNLSNIIDINDPSNGLKDTIYHPLNFESQLDTLLDLEKHQSYENITSKLIKEPKESKYNRMLRRNNFKDPMEDSKHYKQYLELKAFREDIEQKQFERIKKRREQYESCKLDDEKVLMLDQQNTEYMVQSVVNDEISKFMIYERVLTLFIDSSPLGGHSVDRSESLEDIINKCIDQNSSLSFLNSNKSPTDKKSALSDQFKQSFKSLLTKFIQIGLLNVVEQNNTSEAINFLNLDNSESMELFDQYLVDKVNSDVIGNIIELVKPALIAHINQV